MKQAGIAHIEYVIGEIALPVGSLVNKADVLAAHSMPDMKEVWGWEHCRKSALSSLELATAAARRTLARGVAPGSIDALIVCCGDRLNYFEQNQFIGALAQELGLESFQSNWLGGSGCVTLLAAVRLARSLLATGNAAAVLVVTVDKVADDAHRFQRFGVLSDGACSFIVCDVQQAEFSIVDAMVMSSSLTLLHTEDFQAKCQLIQNALERFGAPGGFDYDRVEAFFGPNVFLPIQELEMSLLPIDPALAYADNTDRYGHCYAADPMINLVDFYAKPENRGVRRSLMASTAHGHFGIVALDRR